MKDARKNNRAASVKAIVFWSAIFAACVGVCAFGMTIAKTLKTFALILYIVFGSLIALAALLTVVYAAANVWRYRWAIRADGVEKQNGFEIHRRQYMPKDAVTAIVVKREFPKKAEIVRVTFLGGDHKLVLRSAPKNEVLPLLKMHFGEVYADEEV